jgi:hypothetical protein
MWRQDPFGALIRYTDYGDRSSDYGWEVDHRIPVAAFGIDDSVMPTFWQFLNVQALQWRNNVAKSDSMPIGTFHRTKSLFDELTSSNLRRG